MEGTSGRRFQIRHLLGRGGFGDVYRATMTTPGGLEADVAVKLLRIDGGSGDNVRRLRDEGRLLSALQHPAILRAWDLATLQGRVALVTEYVDGQDLTDCMAASDPNPMPPRALVEAVAQVAEGLEAAWSTPRPGSDQPMRIVHRDIKPSNLRVGPHGHVKILDFGIARTEHAGREAHTGNNATLGSLAYMAPERFGMSVAGPACDTYALGCVLYEGLSGRRLHPDAVPLQMVSLAANPGGWTAHVDEAVDALPASIPDGARDLVRSMLSHDPDGRPATRELAVRCEELAPHLPGVPLKRWARERNWPEDQPLSGPLDGRALTDGTLETGGLALTSAIGSSDTYRFDGPELSATATQPAVAPTSRSPVWIGALAVGTMVLLGLGWVGMSRSGTSDPEGPVQRPTPAPIAAPVPIAAPSPLPTAAEVPSPSPVQVPVPPEPAPAPRPEPARPRPVPLPPPAPAAQAVPEPAPLAAPVAEPTGRISVAGATLVSVEVDGVKVPADAVPSRRDAYLNIDFGQDVHRIGPYLVSPGSKLSVRCVRMTQECELE